MKKTEIHKKAPYAIFLLSLLVSMYFWPAGLFHTDSVISAQNAERGVAEGRVYYLQGRLGYPAYAFFNTGLYYIGHKIFGMQSSENLFILVTMLLSALSSVLMYLFVAELLESKDAAIYSALAYTFMPIHLSLSTYVKDQMFGACAMLLTLIFVLRASKNGKIKNKILAVLLMGLTLAIRQQEFLLMPSFLLIYFWGQKPFKIKKTSDGLKLKISKQFGKSVKDMLLLTVPAVMIFIIAFVPRMLWEPQFDLIDSFKGAGGEQVSSFSLFSPLMTHYALPWATQTITYIGWAALAISLVLGYKENKLAWASMALWMIPYFMIIGNFSQLSPYFIFPAFLPAAVFIGWGFQMASEKIDRKALTALFAIMLIWMLLNIKPVLDYRSQRCGPCEVAKKIGEITPEGAYVESADESRHIEYYGGRRPLTGRPNLLNSTAIKQYLEEVEAAVEGDGFYMTTMGFGNDYMPQGILKPTAQDNSIVSNALTGKTYENLRLVSTSQGTYFTDAKTGLPLPIRGLYTLELLNHFQLVPIFRMQNEDWHHKDLTLAPYNTTIYSLEKRND